MKRSLMAALAAATLAAALPATAQPPLFQKPEDAVKYRKAAFTLMGAHMSRLGAMAQGKAPFDAKVAAENAAVLESLSKLPFVAFLEGTDKGDTKAKAEIWKNWDKFRTAALKMQDEVSKLSAAAKAPGLTVDQLKAGVGGAGGSCKGCHDDFRQQ
ncbi:MAG TPA: cytochrome c [Burkholderiaceae bacterium]|nr:cytochrome c [Burkholderiaceae bacterium]